MAEYRAADHKLIRSIEFDPAAPAEHVTETILMSRGQSYSYLVASGDGDVLVNVGRPIEGERHRERYEQLLGRPLDVRAIVVTQDHPDHWGGWSAFAGPGVETIAQATLPAELAKRESLSRFFLPRMRRALGPLRTEEQRRRMLLDVPPLELTTLVDDSGAFEVGGRTYEVVSVPGGETPDGLAVWIPEEGAVFTGNLTGALYGQFPHLYTIRGDRLRSARQFITSIECVMAFEPALLLTGHDEPVRGVDRIRADLTRLRDMVQHVHNRTVEGMNNGRDLWTLMQEVTLPPELEPAPGRGPLRWYVRAIWEEYVGWFRMESTTELCDVPPQAVWPELVKLAGGPEALAGRAAAFVREGRPVEALHLTDIARAADPAHPAALEAEIAALELLVERTEGKHFDELCWLEGELDRARGLLAAAD